MKKKNILFFLIPIVLLAFLVAISIILEDQDSINSIKFVINSETQTEEVNLFCSDGKYYAFLPSYTNLNDVSVVGNPSCLTFINGKMVDDDYRCDCLKLDTEYKIEIKNILGLTVDEKTLIVKKSNNIPSIFIRLVDGSIDDLNNDKEVEKTGTASIFNSNSSLDFSGSFEAFHTRGNGTWYQEKKPYTIEFKEDTDLLGLGAGKKFVLLADALDDSHLRNKIVYDTAINMGIPFAIKSKYVDLYVDGEYLGLFLLCEKVEVGENRVKIDDLEEQTQAINQYPLSHYDKFEQTVNSIYNCGYDIPNNPENISGGYLLEYQYAYRTVGKESLFKSRNEINFSLESPKKASRAQMSYISDYFQKVEDSLETPDYNRYLDEESWVNFYLIQECFGNIDLGSSFFFKEKDKDKLFAGPIWDFDVSMGNLSNNYHNTASTFYTCKNNNADKSVFEKLYKNKGFYNSIVQEYKNKMRPYIKHAVKKKLIKQGDFIKDSFEMDKLRWKNIQVNLNSDRFSNIESNVEYLSGWLDDRINFLDSAWLDGEKYYRVLLESVTPDGNVYRNYISVNTKESTLKLPSLSKEGYDFLGWYDSSNDKKINLNTVVNDDKVYVAKWKALDDTNGSESKIVSVFESVINKYQDYIPVLIVIIIISVVVLIDLHKFVKKRKWRQKNGK